MAIPKNNAFSCPMALNRFELHESTQCPEVDQNVLLEILRSEYGIVRGNLEELTGYEDRNYLIKDAAWEKPQNADRVIVKITNPIENRYLDHIDAQCEMMECLLRAEIPCPVLVRRKDGRKWAQMNLHNGAHLPMRLFHELPGKKLELFEFSSTVIQEIGGIMARMHNCLDVCKVTTKHIPFITPENFKCLLREAELLCSEGVIDIGRLETVKDALKHYEKQVFEKKDNFDIGLIHSDFNETNILVREMDGKVTGILDFGDAHVAPRVLDIAALILYLQLSDKKKQGIMEITKNVLLGYRQHRRFSVSNQVLMICIRARLAGSLIYGLRTHRLQTYNKHCSVDNYVLKTQSNGWETFDIIDEINML